MKTRSQKEEIVKNLSEKLSRAHSVVLTDFKGLTAKHLNDLRNKLADLEAQFTITKNTLLERALKENTFEVPQNLKVGTTATLFSFADEISPIKILVGVLKETQIKAGFLGKELLDSATVNKLATLPSKKELQGQFVGQIASPLYGIVNVLQGNLRNLVYALEQIRLQKGGE